MPRLGVISDTHGWLRPEALEALRGCDAVAHAGDIGDPHILTALGRVAAVYAVRGNTDRDGWSRHLPSSLLFQIGGLRCALIHDLRALALEPVAEGVGLVISGHTHRAEVRREGSVLYLDPGSAGPRRPGQGVTLCLVEIEGGVPTPTLIPLPD